MLVAEVNMGDDNGELVELEPRWIGVECGVGALLEVARNREEGGVV